MGNMKQLPPIEEIIDYSKASKDSILSSSDICEAREALSRVHCENRGFVYLTKTEFQYLYKAFNAMQSKIETLTADNLQLMQQIEARGKGMSKRVKPIPPEEITRIEHSQQRMELDTIRGKIARLINAYFCELEVYTMEMVYHDGGHADTGEEVYDLIRTDKIEEMIIRLVFGSMGNRFRICQGCKEITYQGYAYCPNCGEKKPC